MVTSIPAEMQADADGLPERLASQSLSMVDAVRRQIDRIAYLRSVGSPWAEAVMQLRDMIVGLEDEEFWDGIPAPQRKALKKAIKEGDAKRAALIKKTWAHEGWLGIRVRAVPGAGGRAIYKPTAENLSDMLRILMRLLHRRRLLWKTRNVVQLPDLEGA